MRTIPRLILTLAAASVVALAAAPSPAAEAAARKVVFLAGTASHGYGLHEHYAGCRLAADLLARHVPGMRTEVHRGWPKDATVLDDAQAIVVDCDGGSLLVSHLDEVDRLMKKGVGLACLHYSVDVPKGRPAELVRSWIGGSYEGGWSVNPTWTADFKSLPDHPIARGVKPFVLRDEWYYNMRFVEDMKGVTPILSAVPPDDTRRNPALQARKGSPEHVAWAYERPGGGRGFGFTGLHTHWNWADDGFRRLLLGAIVWVAGGEVPAGGVTSERPTPEQLLENLDEPRPANWSPDNVRKEIEAMNRPSPGR